MILVARHDSRVAAAVPSDSLRSFGGASVGTRQLQDIRRQHDLSGDAEQSGHASGPERHVPNVTTSPPRDVSHAVTRLDGMRGRRRGAPCDSVSDVL